MRQEKKVVEPGTDRVRVRRASAKRDPAGSERPRPTPIEISKRTRTVLLLAGILALVLLMWYAPSVPLIALGGFSLALIISFPVRLLTRFMPRKLAILVSFLLVIGLLVLAVTFVVPLLIEQLAALITAVPGIVTATSASVRSLLEPLAERGLLPVTTPQELVERFGQDALNVVQNVARQTLGGLVGLVSGTISAAVAAFGMIFIAVYLLLDVRKLKAAYLRAMPVHYRRDAKQLWDDFGYSLSRYLSGLGLVLLIQGVLSGVALAFLGVPYALLLGAWVAVAAIIPYLGAWLGAIPAVILALSIDTTTALLTGVLFLLIQQLEGNVLTPKIQGDALKVHPILVFLAVIAGGELAGLLGVIFAVPALAVLRVLLDFFRLRLRTNQG